MKLEKSYHVKFIDNLKELSIRVEGYIDMERYSVLTDPTILTPKLEKAEKRKERKTIELEIRTQTEERGQLLFYTSK